MSQRQSYIVAGETFKTKTDLQKRIKTILYQYQDREYLSQIDFVFMMEILEQHPDYELKSRSGVKAIYVKQNPVYKNTRNFWIVRLDNSETDFSYLECLKETSHEKKFLNACRVAIEPYTQEYKRKFFDNLNGKIYTCPYTHEALNFIGSHVDHKSPKTFKQLVKGFVSQHKVDVSQVRIVGSAKDNVFQDTFDDKEFEKLWVDYHNSHAEFQVISKKANLSLLKT